ncbi:MAG: hypothetical protein EXS05_13550 [Planctomycetaceae bacterium]|nr:hypothetical protein [Planctomycetaceae bacterium]
MSQQELLTDVIAALQNLGIEFMLSGSHASSLQGEARATHDIDLVANLKPSNVRPLMEAFRSDRFYLSESAVAEAIRTKRMFNLLEVTTGEKVDFWVLTDSAFDQSRFARRQRIDLGDQFVEVSSPEDTILMKLLWCTQSGGSQKQFHDVVRVYELQSNLLDEAYLRKWLLELGVEDLWQRVLDEAEPFIPPGTPLA